MDLRRDRRRIAFGWTVFCWSLHGQGASIRVRGAPARRAERGGYSAGLGISFLYYWPTLLALVSRAAPAKINATMMGLAFMSLFIANTIVGWIGGFYEKMTPAQFWAMHAAIGAMGGLLVVLFGRRLTRVLHHASSVVLKR